MVCVGAFQPASAFPFRASASGLWRDCGDKRGLCNNYITDVPENETLLVALSSGGIRGLQQLVYERLLVFYNDQLFRQMDNTENGWY
jgi:hypothetical protein